MLYIEGEPIADVALLRAGLVRVSVADGDEDVSIALRMPGWLIGATGAVSGKSHLATVTAVSECLVSRVPLVDFERERRTHLGLALALQSMFASELRLLTLRTARIQGRRHRGALEHLLRDLFAGAGALHEDGSVWLEIGLSATDLASLLGVTRQWATVLLTELEAAGDLKRLRGRIIAPAHSSLLRDEMCQRS